LLALRLDQALPGLRLRARHTVEPRLVELVAIVLGDERRARDAMAVGEPHDAALEADETLVDRVELLDETLDTGVVERKALDVADDLLAQLLVRFELLARALLAGDLLLELLVLLLPELLVVARNGV